MLAYADTSFLVSLYGQDTNSAQAQRLSDQNPTAIKRIGGRIWSAFRLMTTQP